MNNNPYQRYKNNSILTASKPELTLMLYDGALKFCNIAIKAIEEKNIQGAHNAIIRVQDIIQEFQITLNREYEISETFDFMYDYIIRRLIEANATKNKEILEEVKGLIKEFRDAWKEAMKAAKTKPVDNEEKVSE
ncbi:MAG: flagellar export chaperone FliS [Epulopiscium sp.]|nr:flagellar export chaperone FliS [Candidatus Epulonipiscium sp.]